MIIALIFIDLIISYATCQYVTTIAGSAVPSTFNGQGVAAGLNGPCGVAVDLNGNVFISDYTNNKIRKINRTGFVSTVAGSGLIGSADGNGTSASFFAPFGIFVDSVENLYVADNNNQKIRLINATGYVTTIAGSGNSGNSDGPSTSASFKYPFGIWVDSSSNNIYITDQWNNVVRMVNASGYVSTYAGSGLADYVNGQGLGAAFNSPNGIAFDAFGNIFVNDLYNNVIRKINSTGYVTTFTGSGQAGAVDGKSSAASFNSPAGLAIDSLGNLYVGEILNYKIRMINTTGYVKTIAGNGIKAFRDGYGLSAMFSYPVGVAVDSNGNVYVADSHNNRIRKIYMHYTTTSTTSTTMTPYTQSALSVATISPASASISPFISSNLVSSSSLSIFQKITSSSTNYKQNLKLTSIFFKTEFTVSFFIAFVLVMVAFGIFVLIKRKSVPITPRGRLMQHERDMQLQMAELRKRTMARMKKTRK